MCVCVCVCVTLLFRRESRRKAGVRAWRSKRPYGRSALESFSLRSNHCFADLHSGFCYPGLHETRPFAGYGKGIRDHDAHYAKGAGTCSKHPSAHPTLLPGIFTVFCPHGVCLGSSLLATVSESCSRFHLMHNLESPETPFSVFFSRLPKGASPLLCLPFTIRAAPLVMVYDNGCHFFSTRQKLPCVCF